MTDHQLVLEHLNNQGQALREITLSLRNHFPAMSPNLDWIYSEFSRVNKEIQDEYQATKSNEDKVIVD
jgi:hypothetical protein